MKSRAEITVQSSRVRPFVYVVYYVHVHHEYHDEYMPPGDHERWSTGKNVDA